MEPRVRIVELEPSLEERAQRARARNQAQLARLAGGAWLAPPLLLAAVVAAFALLRHGPDPLFGYALAAIFGLAGAWAALSIFWPSKPDRACPSCGRADLARIDPRTSLGLVCRSCAWRDESASGWFLAEDEGALEGIVLRQREAKRSGAGAPGPGGRR